jgi:uncharacterized protein (TIGR02757 family)
MNDEEKAAFLLFKADQYENPTFIETDPIAIPHRYKRKEDIEIVGLIMATIAWGNRKSILRSGEKLVSIFGESPYDYVMNFKFDTTLHFVHRTFSSEDLRAFLWSLRAIYQKQGLENCFNKLHEEEYAYRIYRFRNAMLQHAGHRNVHRHLSNPMVNSACKRLNMFLRWMVRSNDKGVDFGLWPSISSMELRIPLDVHTGNVARSLGILQRRQNDWKNSEELYKYCRSIMPQDPSKLDFALFGLGVFENF